MTIALVVLGVVVYAGIGAAVFADAEAYGVARIPALVYGIVWPITLFSQGVYPVVHAIGERMKQ